MRSFVMEKNCEHHNATDDLLSQSYCVGIQKIAGIENAASSNFQIPGKILDERKRAWNDLFEKYSAVVSEVELNIHTLQPEDQIDPSRVMEQRLPMRKPMSMVQYWVDTGNIPHMNFTHNPTHSDSGSSIVEQDCLEPAQNVHSPSLATGPSADKHSNIAETSGNKNLRIVTSSNSSVETAAYILANNNVTKKAETIAIVEGSKADTETKSPTKNSAQIVEMNNIPDQIKSPKMKNLEMPNVENEKFSQSFLSKSYVDKITENMRNANLGKISISKMTSKSKHQESHICSIFFSDSDESEIPNDQNILNEKNQTSNNLSKLIKRKKLYKRSDSPAEFTPVSEDNLSLRTSRLLLEKCLPLRRSEHPALETPRVSSRLLCRTRLGGIKFKRKFKQRQSLSLVSATNNQKNQSPESLDFSKINNITQTVSNKNYTTNSNPTLNQTSSKEDSKDNMHIQESHSQNGMNVMGQSYFNQLDETKKPLAHMTNNLSTCDNFSNIKFKLKPCKVVVQRLPHKYYLSNSSELTTKNDSLGAVKAKIYNQVFHESPLDYSLKSNIVSTNNAANFTYSTNDLSENTTDIRINSFKTFGNIKNVEGKFTCKEKQEKLSDIRNLVRPSDKLKLLEMQAASSNICSLERISSRLKNTNNQDFQKEKFKYVIAESSSDESDLIVPLSNTKNQSVMKSKDSKKLSSKNFYLRSRKYDQSKEDIVGSLITAENEKNFDSPTHENSSKNCSNVQSKEDIVGSLITAENEETFDSPAHEISSKNCSNVQNKRSIQKFSKDNGTDDDVLFNEIKENVYLDKCKHKKSSSDCKKRKHKVKKTSIISSSSEEEVLMPTTKSVEAVDLAIKREQLAKSTHAILSECKNTSNNVVNGKVLEQGFQKKNNVADMNKKLSKVKTKHDKMNVFDKTPEKTGVCVRHKSYNNNNSETTGTLSDPMNDDKLQSRISTQSNVSNNSLEIKKNILPLTKQFRRRDKQRKLKIKTVVTPKISSKKRKSFEIDSSSDEECIIPLKRKE